MRHDWDATTSVERRERRLWSLYGEPRFVLSIDLTKYFTRLWSALFERKKRRENEQQRD